MSDWFFQECIESGRQAALLAAIESGSVGIEDRDCIDRTPLMVGTEEGVRSMVKAIERKRSSALVPAWPWEAVGRVLKHAPAPLARRLT